MNLTNTTTILRQIGAIGLGLGHRLTGDDARFARQPPRKNQKVYVPKGGQSKLEKYNKAIRELGGCVTESQVAKHLGVTGPIRFMQNNHDKFVIGKRVIRGVERTTYSIRSAK